MTKAPVWLGRPFLYQESYLMRFASKPSRDTYLFP